MSMPDHTACPADGLSWVADRVEKGEVGWAGENMYKPLAREQFNGSKGEGGYRG